MKKLGCTDSKTVYNKFSFLCNETLFHQLIKKLFCLWTE